jgi:hypothetical protein
MPKVNSTDYTRKEGKPIKVDGKTQIVFESVEPVNVIGSVTFLQLIKNCQNTKHLLKSQQKEMNTLWAVLTKAEKKEYQDEYDLAK